MGLPDECRDRSVLRFLKDFPEYVDRSVNALNGRRTKVSVRSYLQTRAHRPSEKDGVIRWFS